LRYPPSSNRPPHAVGFLYAHAIVAPYKISDSRKLSNLEREVIMAIQSIRRSDDQALHALLYNDPARLMHHFILATHGHLELRFSYVADELAVEMRTLQRAFRESFKMSMQRCQIDARLSHAKKLLMADPPLKMSVIASLLGYRVTSSFIRFFEEHMNQSPSEWRGEEQSKA
jgi:transcriptional regulator GlxA family with amidase domain